MTIATDYEIGQRVITPKGEGVISQIDIRITKEATAIIILCLVENSLASFRSDELKWPARSLSSQ